jgi:Ribosomal protein L4/L1 family
VTNFGGEERGFMVLAGDVFDVPLRTDIIHRVVKWQLAKRRQVILLTRNFHLHYNCDSIYLFSMLLGIPGDGNHVRVYMFNVDSNNLRVSHSAY